MRLLHGISQRKPLLTDISHWSLNILYCTCFVGVCVRVAWVEIAEVGWHRPTVATVATEWESRRSDLVNWKSNWHPVCMVSVQSSWLGRVVKVTSAGWGRPAIGIVLCRPRMLSCFSRMRQNVVDSEVGELGFHVAKKNCRSEETQIDVVLSVWMNPWLVSPLSVSEVMRPYKLLSYLYTV